MCVYSFDSVWIKEKCLKRDNYCNDIIRNASQKAQKLLSSVFQLLSETVCYKSHHNKNTEVWQIKKQLKRSRAANCKDEVVRRAG